MQVGSLILQKHFKTISFKITLWQDGSTLPVNSKKALIKNNNTVLGLLKSPPSLLTAYLSWEGANLDLHLQKKFLRGILL